MFPNFVMQKNGGGLLPYESATIYHRKKIYVKRETEHCSNIW